MCGGGGARWAGSTGRVEGAGGQDRAEHSMQDSTGQGRTGQGSTREDKQPRPGQGSAGQDRTSQRDTERQMQTRTRTETDKHRYNRGRDRHRRTRMQMQQSMHASTGGLHAAVMGAPGRVDGARVLRARGHSARGCAKSAPSSAPCAGSARQGSCGRGWEVGGERGGEGADDRGNGASQEDAALLGVPLADNAGSPSRI